MIGNRRISGGVPWVENIFVKGTPYAEAYQYFWDFRVRLGERFGIEFDDDDFEALMDAIMDVQDEVGQRMFRYGMEYAKRGYKL